MTGNFRSEPAHTPAGAGELGRHAR